MPYTFLVYTNASEFPYDWKQLIDNDSISCNAYDIVEKASIENITNYYVVTLENNEPIYFSYYQLLKVNTSHFNLSFNKYQQHMLNVALSCVKPTLLVAGNLFRHDVLFYKVINENFTVEKIANIYEATTDFLIQKTNASGIFLKDVHKDIAPFIMHDKSYVQMQDDISMEMELPADWHSMKEYELALKHKYAQRFRKIRKSFLGVTIKEFSLEDIEKYSKEMEQLYLQVSHKQIVSMGTLNHFFFIELKKSLADKYKVCGYFFNEKLIAFSSAIMHNKEYDMNYIGFDYALNNELNLYFNILFHCVENAIACKAEKLILGRTAIEAKAILGCKPDYRFGFYKLRNVIVNWFFQKISAYFTEQQGTAWKNRHPFKVEAGV